VWLLILQSDKLVTESYLSLSLLWWQASGIYQSPDETATNKFARIMYVAFFSFISYALILLYFSTYIRKGYTFIDIIMGLIHKVFVIVLEG